MIKISFGKKMILNRIADLGEILVKIITIIKNLVIIVTY